ncbi:MATE family efflux transporter [Oerskovia merdavium]|uniref:LacI family DNA-binding transcriptional regulator n=1 Tax=Oerskovia merdavium TaxID=2762227 RepID=A0ABR8TXK8_9CELL|nr:MATE family efflux transporter [Oerskovia merdavium]MBD7980487.1 LacI family DNA-binding transcriptional regulator [Oerskovia merdavium]
MKSRVATIQDVARSAEVSTTTVSRVVNRKGFVSDGARLAVLEAIDDLGYVPSAAARGLASRQSGMIGLCLPDTGKPDDLAGRAHDGSGVRVLLDPRPAGEIGWGGLYFGEVLRGAEYAAWEAGLALTVATAREPDLEARVLAMAGRVDGLVVVAQSLPDDLLDHVARRVPLVVLAGPMVTDRYDHVTVDNAAGMTRLVEHLVVDHGIRDLAYVAGRAGTPDDAILGVGAPSFLAGLGTTLLVVLVNLSLVRTGGATVLAAFAVCARLQTFATMPQTGISQGLQPVVGYNAGARLVDRVRRARTLALRATTLYSVLAATALAVLAEPLVTFFVDEPDVVRTGSVALRVLAVGLAVSEVAPLVSAYFQALGRARPSYLISLGTLVGIKVPLVLVLGPTGSSGTWIALAAGEVLAALAALLVLLAVQRRDRRGAP